MPETEAGKRLLREHLDAAVYCGMPTGVFIDSIDAIEAEAVAAERARIRAAVEGLPRWAMVGGLTTRCMDAVPDGPHVDRAAVLRIIGGEASGG